MYVYNGRMAMESAQTFSISQTMRVQSSEAETKYFESADQATSEIPSVWPRKIFSSVPSETCQIRTVASAANKHKYSNQSRTKVPQKEGGNHEIEEKKS